MNRLLCFLPLLLLASCEQPCLAQIILTSNQVQVVSGLDNPRIVGGVVMFDGPSQPKMEAAALVELKAEKAYKFLDLEAESTDWQLGNLTKLDDTHWLLRGSGKYRLSALAFDPDLARARLFVELAPPAPPVPPGPQPPQPPDPPGPSPDLSPVAKASREAMQAFVQSMAGNMDQLSAGAKSGQFKTVRDAGAKAHEMSLVSQKAFESAMDAILQPKLGGGDLQADAAQVFLDVSTGFKGVK